MLNRLYVHENIVSIFCLLQFAQLARTILGKHFYLKLLVFTLFSIERSVNKFYRNIEARTVNRHYFSFIEQNKLYNLVSMRFFFSMLVCFQLTLVFGMQISEYLRRKFPETFEEIKLNRRKQQVLKATKRGQAKWLSQITGKQKISRSEAGSS